VRRILSQIEEVCNFKKDSAVIYDLCCLIYTVLLISHFVACAWSFLANLEKHFDPTVRTWEDEYGISEEDWTIKYTYAMYWTAVTSMTTGYGDILP
jgi:hypothetical protein